MIVCYAAEPQPPQLVVRELMNRNLVLRFVLLYTMPDEAFRQAAADITAALAAGLLTPPPTTSSRWPTRPPPTTPSRAARSARS